MKGVWRKHDLMHKQMLPNKQYMCHENDVTMGGIGMALDDTFEGHWWGIGGHWRALVHKSHMSAHTRTNNAHHEKQRKTYENH